MAPEWTALASGVYKNSSGKAVFYGLGAANKEEMTSDSKNLSKDRAHEELTKVITSSSVFISKSNLYIELLLRLSPKLMQSSKG